MSDEMKEQEEQYVEVLWEDGSTIKCEIYDVIDYENKTYALLLPLDQKPENETDDAEVIVMEYVEEGEEGYFQSIEDEKEFNRVCEYIQSLDDEEEEE